MSPEETARKYNELLEHQRILTCAFCGHEYPPDTPPSQHEALTEHVKVCAKHPLNRRIAELEAKRDRLKKQVEELNKKHKTLLEVTVARSRCRADELRAMADAIQIQDADIEAIHEKNLH